MFLKLRIEYSFLFQFNLKTFLPFMVDLKVLVNCLNWRGRPIGKTKIGSDNITGRARSKSRCSSSGNLTGTSEEARTEPEVAVSYKMLENVGSTFDMYNRDNRRDQDRILIIN